MSEARRAESVSGGTNDGRLTRTDRESLLKLARLRERVAKTGVAKLRAKLLSDFEKEMDRTYHYDQDEVWKQAHKAADETVAAAQKMIHERCRALGIPDRFAPSIHCHWYYAGEQASKKRRDELRGMASKHVDTGR